MGEVKQLCAPAHIDLSLDLELSTASSDITLHMNVKKLSPPEHFVSMNLSLSKQ